LNDRATRLLITPTQRSLFRAGLGSLGGNLQVENAVQIEPVGEFELKGIRRPMAAYNVIGTLS